MNGEIVKPTRKEVRSKRVNILLPPSLYKEVKKNCKDIGISLNECLNQLISNWVANNTHREDK